MKRRRVGMYRGKPIYDGDPRLPAYIAEAATATATGWIGSVETFGKWGREANRKHSEYNECKYCGSVYDKFDPARNCPDCGAQK